MLPVPVSADSQRPPGGPGPDGPRGSAWPSPPWQTEPSPAWQLQPEAPWCWLQHLWPPGPTSLKLVPSLWQPHLKTIIDTGWANSWERSEILQNKKIKKTHAKYIDLFLKNMWRLRPIVFYIDIYWDQIIMWLQILKLTFKMNFSLIIFFLSNSPV